MGVNLAAMAVGARLFCQTTASLWQLPLPFLPAVTLKIILPGTLVPVRLTSDTAKSQAGIPVSSL